MVHPPESDLDQVLNPLISIPVILRCPLSAKSSLCLTLTLCFWIISGLGCLPHEAALHQGHHLLPRDEPVTVNVIDLEAVLSLFLLRALQEDREPKQPLLPQNHSFSNSTL